MIEKVLRLLQGGTDVRRILLMTFTKAAASEMREKLVKKMYEQSNEERIKKQLDNVPFSHIETIHGFCYSLMRKYFNVAECDPSVAIGEENAMQKALDECMNRVLEERFARGEEDFLMTADFFRQRRSYDNFKNAISEIMRFASTKKDKEAFYALCASDDGERTEKYYLRYRKTEISYAIGLIRSFLQGCEEEGYAENVLFYEGMEERLREGMAVQKAQDLFPLFALKEKFPTKISVQKVKNGLASNALSVMSDRVNTTVKNLYDKIQADAEAYRQSNKTQARVKKVLIDVCLAVEKEYAAYKKRRKIIDVQDAVYAALRILRNDKAREEIRASFDYVFVDEYQDTDYMQEELIDLLAGDNLFLVGDVKQAIYHFRSSEPEIFLHRGEKYESGVEGKNKVLNTNFRSCPEVLDFTNRVCDRVMVKDFCGIDYMGSARLRYGETVKNVDERRAVQVFVDREKEERALPAQGTYSVRSANTTGEDDRESMFVARKILSFVGQTEIEEGGERRKVRFKDVAVLVRKSKYLRALFDAFDKSGVPYYTLKETDVPFPEREALVDTLRVSLNATDDISLFHVLSSPIGNFTPADLTEMRAKDRTGFSKMSLWETLISYKGDPKIEEKAKEIVDFLEKLRIKSAYCTAEEALNAVLEKNYDSYLLGKNADVLRNLNAFVSYVGTISENASVETFLEFYDTSYKGNKPPVPEDAVAVMTMHGSKGLEFPVVFLPFQTTARPDGRWQIRLETELGLAVKAYDDENKTATETFETRVFRMKIKDEERQELARLMYVAFTRAKNYLVVSGKEEKVPASVFDDGESVMKWILMAADADEKLAALVEDMVVDEREETPEVPVENKPFDGSRLKRAYRYEQDTARPVKYSVSEILAKQDGYGVNPFAGDKSSAELGTAIHTVMQYVSYDLTTEGEVDAAMDEMVRTGTLLPEERKKVPAGLILSVLRSEVIKNAKKYPCKREQPFMMYVLPEDGGEDKVLVQGVIDLLVDEGDGYVVVDFKTGGGDAERLQERYAKQLSLYAEGVEKILKKRVKRKVIVSVTGGFSVDV